MLWVADRIRAPTATGGRPVEARERVAVAVTGAPSSDRVVRRAARLAGRLGGDLVGIHVQRPGDLADRPDAVRALLEDLGGRWVEVEAEEVAPALVQVARSEGATQLVLGVGVSAAMAPPPAGHHRDRRARAGRPARRPRHRGTGGGDGRRPRRPRGRPPCRRADGRSGGSSPSCSLRCSLSRLVPFRRDLDLATVLLAFLLVAVIPAAVGGTGPGAAGRGLRVRLANWYFTEPVGSWTIAESEHVLALALTLPVAGAVGLFVSRAARQATAATRARADAAALARAAVTTIGSPDPLLPLLELAVSEVGLTRRPGGGGRRGGGLGRHRRDAATSVARLPIGDGAELVAWGAPLGPPSSPSSRRWPPRWRRRSPAAGWRRRPPAPRTWPRPATCAAPSSTPRPTTCGRRSPASRRPCPASWPTTSSGTRRPPRSSSPPSTRRPIGSTTSSPTCST